MQNTSEYFILYDDRKDHDGRKPHLLKLDGKTLNQACRGFWLADLSSPGGTFYHGHVHTINIIL